MRLLLGYKFSDFVRNKKRFVEKILFFIDYYCYGLLFFLSLQPKNVSFMYFENIVGFALLVGQSQIIRL